MRINSSALKHGVSTQDIIYALEYSYQKEVVREDPQKLLYLSFSKSGIPLEIISIITDDGDELVIHAMRTRKIYRIAGRE